MNSTKSFKIQAYGLNIDELVNVLYYQGVPNIEINLEPDRSGFWMTIVNPSYYQLEVLDFIFDIIERDYQAIINQFIPAPGPQEYYQPMSIQEYQRPIVQEYQPMSISQQPVIQEYYQPMSIQEYQRPIVQEYYQPMSIPQQIMSIPQQIMSIPQQPMFIPQQPFIQEYQQPINEPVRGKIQAPENIRFFVPPI